jgi:hypothetical protein
MYELERLAQDVFFEVLNQERDSVRVGPCLATVVAWFEPVGVVCLIDKGAVGFKESGLDVIRRSVCFLPESLPYPQSGVCD